VTPSEEKRAVTEGLGHTKKRFGKGRQVSRFCPGLQKGCSRDGGPILDRPRGSSDPGHGPFRLHQLQLQAYDSTPLGQP